MDNQTGSDSGSDRLQEALRAELQDLNRHLRDLQDREEQIQTELQDIQSERRQYESRVEHAMALLEPRESVDFDLRANIAPDSMMPDAATAAAEYPPQGYRSNRSTTGSTLSENVYQILKETEPSPDEPGTALHYRDLVKELQSRGIFISGRDPGLNLVANIHRDERFFRPERGKYGLRDWYPSAQRNVGQRTSRK